MVASITVRAATERDLEPLGRLGALLVAEHHDFDPKRFIAPLPLLPQRYGEFLVGQSQQAGKLVHVAEREGAVVGYVYAAIEGTDYKALRGPAGVVYDLVVDPAHRRQRIGMTLLEHALRALQELGAPRALLFTAEKNDVAQEMFARAGFRRTMIEMTREL